MKMVLVAVSEDMARILAGSYFIIPARIGDVPGTCTEQEYAVARAIHRVLCGCAASEREGEGWCDSLWAVAGIAAVAAMRNEERS